MRSLSPLCRADQASMIQLFGWYDNEDNDDDSHDFHCALHWSYCVSR
jgi:hypothetical protein